MRGVRYEADLLTGRVDQREPAFRVQHREREAREAGTRADVRYRAPVQIALNGEAVEEVVRHHILTLGDRRKVIGTIPLFELVQELHESRCVGHRQVDTHTPRVAYKTISLGQWGP